jgi:hypothetical protein
MVPHMPHIFELIHFKDRKDLPHLGMVVMLIGGIILGVYLALQPQLFSKRAAEGSLIEIKFVDEAIEVEQNRIYEAKIGVNPKGEKVTAMQLDLGYDPTAVTILEIKNEGFLPVTLKTEDNFSGTHTLVYAGLIQNQTTQPGMVATVKFKYIGNSSSTLSIKPGSQVNIISKEGNVLNEFDSLSLQTIEKEAPGEPVEYPDNLLLEKAFFPDSQPYVDDVKESLEEKPKVGADRIEPEFSQKYILQLGRDIFIEPIVALNEVIEDKATDILQP